MSALALCPVIPPTAPEMVESLKAVQAVFLRGEQVDIYTEHVIHAGMYTRTITMPPGLALVGAHMKRPMMVMSIGQGYALVNRKWVKLQGFQVLPASANRKQIFVSDPNSPLILTTVMQTSAKTVAEAEDEFTSEAELLLSRRQDLNRIRITGE